MLTSKGDVSTLEDLVFAVTEETAPYFFPEILILHVLPVPRPKPLRRCGIWFMVVMTVRGMAAVLSSDFIPCLGSLPGVCGAAQAVGQRLREQSSNFSGMRLCSLSCSYAFISIDATTKLWLRE